MAAMRAKPTVQFGTCPGCHRPRSLQEGFCDDCRAKIPELERERILAEREVQALTPTQANPNPLDVALDALTTVIHADSLCRAQKAARNALDRINEMLDTRTPAQREQDEAYRDEKDTIASLLVARP